MLEELKQSVYEANIRLAGSGLVTLTWGNASGYNSEMGLVVIKPSGVDYDKLRPADMVVLNLKGEIVEGKLNPSSDTPTHLKIYSSFSEVGGIVHTHSGYAVAWAQAGRSIPAMGTTHADHFYGDVPCSRKLTIEEVQHNYEENTGKLIVETVASADPMAMPAVLVNDHGPFTWGKTPSAAVDNAIALEAVARMAFLTMQIAGNDKMDKWLLDKHFRRKHGSEAYYGQKRKKI